MANGASTALLEQAIRTLLQGRNPSPLAPVPTGPMTPPGGPLLLPPGPAPTPAPVAPLPARNDALIEQLTGPRPVAPVEQPDSLLQKISRALIGFGAGMQGQGPQYLERLQEQRERPMREFKAETERYEQRRAGAVEFDERRREREQSATQAQADVASEREFRQWVQRTGATDARALEELRQAFETQRDARKLEADRLETERRERIQQERDAKQIENQYFNLSKNRGLSVELGKYWAGLKDSLSPAAAALDRRLASLGDVKMSRSMGGGGRTGAGNAALKVAREIEDAKGALIALQQRGGDPRQERAIRTRIDRAIGRARSFPGQLQTGIGEGDWPFVKIWDGEKFVGLVADNSAPAPVAQPAQGSQQTATEAQLQQYARENQITLDEAREDFRKAGVTIR